MVDATRLALETAWATVGRGKRRGATGDA